MSRRQKKSVQKFAVKNEVPDNGQVRVSELVTSSNMENMVDFAHKHMPASEQFPGGVGSTGETKSLAGSRGSCFWRPEEGSINNKSSGGEEQADELRDSSDPGVGRAEGSAISSLEFIWSEIRSENVLEKDVDCFEAEEAVLDGRIPKNVLGEVYQVPRKLEYLLNFSILLCFDTILYDLTFLPINSAIALMKLVVLVALSVVNGLMMFLVTGKPGGRGFRSGSEGRGAAGVGRAECGHPVGAESWGFARRERSGGSGCGGGLAEGSSVEYIFEERRVKSKSLTSIPEYEDGLRQRLQARGREEGFLGRQTSHFLPQIRNHIHSYRMSDQRSSLEESELRSVPALEAFYDGGEGEGLAAGGGEETRSEAGVHLGGGCFRLTVIELTDLSRFLVLVLSIYVFSRLDISFFYHYFRGQGLLKLYVIFNMLEIFEKLFRSFGRDLIDTYLESVVRTFSGLGFVDGRYEGEEDRWSSSSSSSGPAGPLLDSASKYCLVIVYLLIHCTIHMIRGLALNISLNSSEYTMFLIVITNNFAEIKSTVFKTYHSISLFTISCSDTIERFQLLYDGCILFIRMYSNARLYTDSIYSSVATWVVSVYLVEIVVDWFKHSFLVKFNKINSDCYCGYLDTLIGDVLLSRGSSQAFQYLTADFNRKNMQQRESSSHDEKLVSSRKSPWSGGKPSDYHLCSNANSNASFSRQGTCSFQRGNTMGLEADVSLNQHREVRTKKIKSDDRGYGAFHMFESKSFKGDEHFHHQQPVFVSKRLRGVYAFPYIVSRRIGFVSLPLTILLMCVLLFSRLHSALCISHLVVMWLVLFILKYLSSFTIVSISQSNIDRLKGWSFDYNKINAL